uniref:ADP-ribosyl transferase 19-1 n=1 Tax=Miichthys miiuy TaxID=240162 RepID=A0AB39ACA0_MIIMI
MPDTKLCLEALSALSGCNVESTSGSSLLTPQDFVNIVALKEFYKQEGFQELEYPSVGTLSLRDIEDQDMYSSPLALAEGPSTAGPPESLRPNVKINPQDFFHPQYDYDFTHIKDGDTKFLRGNEQYTRPCGWNRAALQVMQKYDSGDQWLGMGKDAWPVSYSGHNMDGSLGIILTHGGSPDEEPKFLDAAAASLVTGETKGRGVYSTPEIKTAEKYCKTFKSKVDGKTYKVVLQNRINPEKRVKCQREDIWLVYIPEGTNEVQTRAIVQTSIRPYGLLLKQV